MIRTILVPVSGTQIDDSVFAMALAVAERTGAHLAFHHIKLSATEAALHAPHMAYCIGPGLPKALTELNRKVEELAGRALANVEEFCADYAIALGGRPAMGQVTASWSENTDPDAEDLLTRARHADLTVAGRPHQADYLPPGLIESLLLKSGRPVVLPPEGAAPPPSIDTIMVAWKETAAAARALAAAMPLLQRARRVIVAHVKEAGDHGKSLSDLIYHLARHGIGAERKEIDDPHADAATLLPAVALALDADLLVLGGYSHRPLTEQIFGGVTRSVIESAPLPVFLLH